ncbi:MAG TPA: FHA domain-containing protein [Vicinamibacteria bacterium]|nr:FHA domain-containing protein [Vicinamibacteria bacterium]
MTSLWLLPPDGDPIRVDGDRSVVGRDPHVDVVVNDNSVSRKHAVIERDSDTWIVADQKSANGTWIDGQRVIRAILKPGQQVRFGAVSFDISLEKPASRGRAGQTAEPPPPPRRPQPPPAPHDSTRAAPPPRRGHPPAAGGSSLEEAAELLGVLAGAPKHEIRKKYQKIYNDYQIRLTNAPTPSLKRMYQKNLQDLKAAAELLSPGILDDGA